jgi:hypothetical protein
MPAWSRSGKGGAQTSGLGNDAGNAEADVIGALIAEHLRRQARHDGAFDGRRAVGIEELLRERGEEARRRRPEADADDVHIHALTFHDGFSAHCDLS